VRLFGSAQKVDQTGNRSLAKSAIDPGITDYLTNGGRIEVAQRMAGHSNAKTTGLYDRRNDGQPRFLLHRGAGFDLPDDFKPFANAVVLNR
jgi:hypothetical protein